MARRVLVCGGRDYTDRKTLYRILDGAHKTWGISCIIHGNARGADTLAAEWAKSRGVPDDPYPADWTRHGKAAGPIRNQEMITKGRPDIAFSFPGGKGTADMRKRLKKAGITCLNVIKESDY